MQQDIETPRVVAVIPTFHPSYGLVDRVGTLLDQVEAVVIADDGSGPGVVGVLDQLRRQGAHVLPSSSNTGIAAALNRGITSAHERGATHVLTIDQDSTLAQGYVAAALHAFVTLREAGRTVLAVGAGVIDGHPMPAVDEFAGFPRLFETLQSGLLFDTARLRQLGPFDEGLFIDCVDTEMLLRGAAAGLDTFLSRECELVHQLGDTREVKMLGKRLQFAYHGPLRRYYITRNRAVMKARFARRFPGWAAVQVRDQTRFFVYCVLFGPDRGRQLLAATAGLLDAVRGRRGPVRPRLAGLLTR